MVPGRVKFAAIAALAVAAAAGYFLAWQSHGHTVVARHPIEFYHAADKEQLLQHETLYQLEPLGYYMDADSVFCGEGVCRIDTVRIFWTDLGFYDGYELDKGTRLEKYDGEDFDPEDYEKLDRVLRNRDSSLATLAPMELVKTPRGGNSVDALTGATVFIPRDDYVAGAIWTSYTLWHYLHGEVAGIVRNLTGDGMTEARLLALTGPDHPDQAVFALEQLARRESISEEGLRQVLGIAIQPPAALHRPLVKFAESFPGARYFQAISQYLDSHDEDLVVMGLESLLKREENAPGRFLQAFAEGFGRYESFRQNRLALEYLERQGGLGLLSAAQIEDLLEDDNFVIARNAYWVLTRTPAGEDKSALLSHFYKTNRDRL